MRGRPSVERASGTRRGLSLSTAHTCTTATVVGVTYAARRCRKGVLNSTTSFRWREAESTLTRTFVWHIRSAITDAAPAVYPPNFF